MKNKVFLLAIVAIAVLFILAVALYGVSTALMPGTQHEPSPTPADGQDNVTPAGVDVALDTGDVRTAFGSLSSASADTAVRNWLADKKIVYVAGIASDFCALGESDQWTITYASDKGEYIVFVSDGSIIQTLDSQSSMQQGIDPRTIIDSDRAWQVAADDISASGGTLPETASMKLMIMDGKPCWDISYRASDGFRILRIDAANGTISDRATIGL